MDSYQEVFEAAEEARVRGDNEVAVELYRKAVDLADMSSADLIALYHMWGVALINIGLTEKARWQLQKGYSMCMNNKRRAAILRDFARSYRVDGDLAAARWFIDRSLHLIPLEDLAERGASLGFKARILLAGVRHPNSTTESQFLLGYLARDGVFEALELFGTADVLLQRSGNHHYELYNLMHFLEALIEHRLGLEDNDGERYFTAAQTPRLRALVAIYGGPPHQERASQIIEHIFAAL